MAGAVSSHISCPTVTSLPLVQGFETLLAPEEGRFRIMRQSSASVGGIKAVPDQLQLEASEKAAAQQLRAGQSERHRPQRSTC